MKYGGFGKDSLEKGEEVNMKKNEAREKKRGSNDLLFHNRLSFRSGIYTTSPYKAFGQTNATWADNSLKGAHNYITHSYYTQAFRP